MAEPLISVVGLSQVYRKRGEEIRAVDGVDLTFQEGQFTVLHGTSGAGKSTLLYLLGALGRPTSGSITVDGEELGRLTDTERAAFRRQKVGFVFQSFYLVPTLTAVENVAIPLVPLGRPAAEVTRQAEAALAQVGLSHRRGHYPGELSGGEQQRTAIARALVMQPEILLADEPTSDLDRRTAEQIVTLLEGLSRDRGCTVIMATHDQRILSHAARLVEMEDGQVIGDVLGGARHASPADGATT